MVKHKHQKSKPSNKHRPHAKKQGKRANISEFRAQLDVLGLKIIEVTSDGNCFFRALADQLQGNEEEHEKYRNMVVQYIVDNREMFEPFIEDGEPFEKYCQSMQNDGTWAGHMELQAASLVTRNNICIHHHMSPRWYIQNFGGQGANMIHLSYHDGEHYNSVRMKEDPCNGPAKPVSIEADVNLTASSQATKNSGSHSTPTTSKQNEVVKMVMAGSNCNDEEKVEQVLQLVDGDADAAIEFLIAERDSGETDELNSVLFEHDIDSKDQSIGAKRVGGGKSSFEVDKNISRNKVCPCGSKKKYKSCCGTAAGRAPSKSLVEQESNYVKGKRGKQGKKGTSMSRGPSITSNGAVPDLGALCI